MIREIDHSAIIRACVQGSPDAQRQLYNLYARQMFGVCLRLLNHREDAEDVLQESFVAAFSALASFREESSFGSWLKRIVINKSLNYLKRKKISFATYGEDLAIEVEEVELQENELTVEAIKETLAELPHGYRLVFSLYMFENMSHKEIAQHLDISEGTSKSQLNRAKQKLKEKLEEQGYGRG